MEEVLNGEAFERLAGPSWWGSWAGFVDKTDYDAFNVTSALSHLGNETPPGRTSGSFHVGPGSFWFVCLDMVPQAVPATIPISVELG